ncbi:hypothetical protein BDR04DRAFT_505139 [Suillus decipiens]|nr:hypothetical protein BDR04DRAFT_505139 [Suillus decipiens]
MLCAVNIYSKLRASSLCAVLLATSISMPSSFDSTWHASSIREFRNRSWYRWCRQLFIG